MNLRIKSWFRERPALLGYQLLFKLCGRPNPIHLWDDDKQFTKLMEEIFHYTLVDKKRCFMIYQFTKQIACLPGNVAEVGVFKGGTARLLAEAIKGQNKSLHLFDTFEGMPPTNPSLDIVKKGDFKDTSLEDVKAYLADFRNIYYYPGLFPESAKATPVENLKFSLVHIDVDMHKSVVDCCDFFYQKIEKGGIMIFDDYGQLSCPGVKVAVDEFFFNKVEKPCYLPTGQCIVMRI